MKMIIHTFSHAFAEDLGVELIPMGIEGVEALTPEEVTAILAQEQATNVVLTENPDVEFMKKLKLARPGLHLFLLAHQNLKPEELRSLQTIGITSIINYSESIPTIADEVVKDIIKNNIRTAERRFHVRVQPRDVENVKGAVFLKDLRRFVRGNILDISAGGLAIRLEDSLEASLLIPMTLYEPLLISMKGMQIKTLARMVAKRNDVAGFKFENVEAGDMKKIAVYIHKKISENTKKLTEKV